MTTVLFIVVGLYFACTVADGSYTLSLFCGMYFSIDSSKVVVDMQMAAASGSDPSCLAPNTCSYSARPDQSRIYGQGEQLTNEAPATYACTGVCGGMPHPGKI